MEILIYIDHLFSIEAICLTVFDIDSRHYGATVRWFDVEIDVKCGRRAKVRMGYVSQGFIPTYRNHSFIHITKRSPPRTHHRAQRQRTPRRKLPQINLIRQLELRAGRIIQKRARATDGVCAVFGIFVLPEGPETVDLGVMQEK